MASRTILAAGCAALLFLPAYAPAQVEEASARFIPWSGYWWPHHEARILGPLGKYDKVTGKHAAEWEKSHHPRDVDQWYGYCHGWSASSIMEGEPTQAVSTPGDSGAIALTVGDQKGLLALCHAHDVVNSYGTRNDGQPDHDPQGLHPDTLWQLLKLYVKEQGVPLVLDLDPGVQVWNYPVYAYRVEYKPSGDGDNQYLGALTLWMADDAVPPDYVGTKVRRHTYQFAFEMRNRSVKSGSGKWVGASEKDHPDFAWYPYVARAENPDVDYAAVQKMLGSSSPPPPNPDPIPDPNYPPQPRGGTDSTPPARVVSLSPNELMTLLADKASSFHFVLTVDGFGAAQYQIGQAFSVSTYSEQEGYLYVFEIDDDGGVKLLFPMTGQDNRVPANAKFDIGGGNDKNKVKLVCAGPVGQHHIKGVVTSRPLLLTGLDRSKPEPRQDGGQSQDFRWPPTEKGQVQEVLQQTQRGKLKPQQVQDLTGAQPSKILGDFAQSEMAIYVGDKTGPKPEVPDKTKPDVPDKTKPGARPDGKPPADAR